MHAGPRLRPSQIAIGKLLYYGRPPEARHASAGGVEQASHPVIRREFVVELRRLANLGHVDLDTRALKGPQRLGHYPKTKLHSVNLPSPEGRHRERALAPVLCGDYT